jgi:hypothetical protein
MQLATVTTGSTAAAADPAAVEDIHVRTYGEMEEQNHNHQKLEAVEDPAYDPSMNGHLMKRLLWHGGSVYDAWFSAASNQVRATILSVCLSLCLSIFLLYSELLQFSLHPYPWSSVSS